MRSFRTYNLGWTNHKPSRIKANDGTGNTLTISTGHMTGTDDQNHRQVAIAFVQKMNWCPVRIVGGGDCRPNGGINWVMIDKNSDLSANVT